MDPSAPLPLAVSPGLGQSCSVPTCPQGLAPSGWAGTGLHPMAATLDPVLLEWKSAPVCQPSPELSPAHTAQPSCSSALSQGDTDPGWQLLVGATRRKVLGQHQEFSSLPSLPVPHGTLTLLGPHPLLLGYRAFPCSPAPPPRPAVHIWDQNLCCAARAPQPHLLLARGELGSAPGRYRLYLGFGDQ